MLVEDQFKLPYILESRPSPEFSYNAAITKLVGVITNLPDASSMGLLAPGDQDSYEPYAEAVEVGFSGTRGNFLKLSACVDLSSQISIGCAGAALTYLGRRKSIGFLPGTMNEASAFRVSSIAMFSLGDMMHVQHSITSMALLWLTRP